MQIKMLIELSLTATSNSSWNMLQNCFSFMKLKVIKIVENEVLLGFLMAFMKSLLKNFLII